MQTVALTEGGGTHSAASDGPADGRANHHVSLADAHQQVSIFSTRLLDSAVHVCKQEQPIAQKVLKISHDKTKLLIPAELLREARKLRYLPGLNGEV